MPVDPSIALQTQVPNPTNLISGFIDLGQKKLAFDKAKATYGADVAQRQADSTTAQNQATVSTANVQPLIQQQAAQTSSAQTAADYSKYQLTGAQQQKAVEIASGLVSDPDVVAGNTPAMMAKINDAQTRMVQAGIDPGIADANATTLKYQAIHSPMQVQQSLKNMILGGQNAGGQAATIQPSGPMVANGQQAQQVNTNPFAPGQGAPVPGTGVQMQLPPTTPVYNPTTGAPGYLGPNPNPAPQPGDTPAGLRAQIDAVRTNGGQPIDPRDQPAIDREVARLGAKLSGMSGGVQSGPGIGDVSNREGVVGTVQKDWSNTNQSAASAAQDIGVLQHIKQLAPDAATGVTGAREALIAGIAGRLGMSPAEMTKTSTDLLAKNSNMLALAGGNTDMARSLAEAANPNAHMTAAAIQQAADQVIAQRQMSVNKQKLLLPYVNNPDAYNAVLSHFNDIGDPRGLQYNTMTPAQKSTLKSSMSATEQQKFGAMLDAQHAMGWR